MLLVYKKVLRELLLTFLFALLFLNFALMVEKLIRMTRILAGVGTSFLDIAKIIFFLQPEILIVTIPMSLLLSVLITYGRMYSDNELIILRNSGLSFLQISKPVIYFGICCFILSIMMSFYFGPKSSTLLRQKVSEILTKRTALTIEEGIFNTAFKDIVILIKEKPSENLLKGLFILDERQKDEQRVIVAQEGVVGTDGESINFNLINGHIYVSKKKALTEISFGRYQFSLTPTTLAYGKRRSEMTPWELLNLSKLEPEQKSKYIPEFYRRLSLPALCLVIIFLAPPLSLLSGKSGRVGGVAIGLAIFTIYYTLLLYGENLAKSGQITYFVGSWLSFFVLTVTSTLLFYRVNRR